MTDPYYEKLQVLTERIARDFTDDATEGSPVVAIWAPRVVESNFPWLYLEFKYEGPLSLYTLKEVERRFESFAAAEGGSLQNIHMSRRGDSFMVKLVYIPGKKKAPGETRELPNDNSEVNF